MEQVTTAVVTDTLGMSPGYPVRDNGIAAAPVLDQDLVILLGVLSDSGRTHGNATASWADIKKMGSHTFLETSISIQPRLLSDWK